MQNVLFQYLMILVPQQNSIKKVDQRFGHEFVRKYIIIFFFLLHNNKKGKILLLFLVTKFTLFSYGTPCIYVHNTYLAFNIIFLEQDVYQQQHHSVRFCKFSPYYLVIKQD